MPYAVPSPSTSPVATMTFQPRPASPKKATSSPSVATLASSSPRREEKRSPRHHQRSHSSEPIASTSSFIFVQPATPDSDKRLGERSYLWTSGAGSPSGRTSPSTVPRQQRRIRLAPLTTAGAGVAGKTSPTGSGSSSPGPSSQDDSLSDGALRGRKEGVDEQRTPRPGDGGSSIFTNSLPFGPNSSSPSPLPTPDDDAMAQKPALMVRKKSGELVRPSLKADTMRRDFSKPRSAPATPVCPKYVHFDTQLEHVKHFLAQQRPAAVSRSGSPIETETEDEPEAFPFPAMATAQAGTVKLVLPNFPTGSRLDQDAYVESLEMTTDGKNIRGIVRVKNLAFEKWVAVRFTLDHWQTVSEVSAEYHDTLAGNTADRFSFTIKLQDLLARIEEKTMFLAVRYTVGGKEIWDNNGGQNYRVEFKKMPAPPSSRAATAAAANAAASRAAAASAEQRRKNAWSVTNAGQAADRMADLRRELERLTREDNFDDDDDASTGAGLAASSTTGLGIGGAGSTGRGALRLNEGNRSFSDGAGLSLSGRYDFGNSLKMYTDRGSQPKRQDAPSPSSLTVPLPNSPSSFFNPVSTSPQRPRAPPLPAGSHTSSSPTKPYTTTLINGHPATVYDPTFPAGSPIINSHRAPADSPLHSPRANLQPDFGLPSTSAKSPASASSAAALPSKAYYSPTLPTFPAPRSPPRDPSASSYFYPAAAVASGATSPFLPLQEIPSSSAASSGFGNGANGTPRTRYASYPVGSAKASDAVSTSTSGNATGLRTAGFSPLVPPSFRDNRNRSSPFASPAPSPPNGMSPSGSPRGGSALRLRSPPPELASNSASENDSDYDPPGSQMWSPATTDSASSVASSSSSGTARGAVSPFTSRRTGSADSQASSLLSSPESDLTSVAPDSPGYGGGTPLSAGAADKMARPSSALEFSNFLDRYRFHLNSNPSLKTGTPSSFLSPPSSSLGLSPPASLVASPTSPSDTTSSDFFTLAAAASSASASAGSTPIAITTTGATSPGSSAASTVGSPTPPRRLSPLAVAAATSASPSLSPVPSPMHSGEVSA
ncbi:hypothetical protein JCM10207_001809 [Rhodosporidiobolus poonsookiae]